MSEIHRPDVIMHDKNCYCDWCIKRRETPNEKLNQLQARVKELEELLAKEEHARSQANFAVVLLQERLKVFEEFCKEES